MTKARPLQFIKRHRSLFKITVTILIAVIVFDVLAARLQELKFDDIRHSLNIIPGQAIAQASLLTLASYFGFLAYYEYIGQRYVHKFMGLKRLYLASFITYAFNFNLGSILGAIATRFRIYRRWQLKHFEIVQLTSACIFISWLGYIFLGSFILLTTPEALNHLRFHNETLARITGGLLMVALITLFIVSRRVRMIHFNRWHFKTLNRKQLFFALIVSTLQWLTLTTIIYIFLSCFNRVDYILILFAYLFAAVATVVVHVPAGLGVVEGTFILVLDGVMPPAEIIAAMIGFRTVYYLIPFIFSLVAFSCMELQAWRLKVRRV